MLQSGGLWLHQQPAVPLSKNSIAKYLDPYVSTTHTTHTQFSDDQIRENDRNDAITFYRMDLISELCMCKQPVYDAVMFKDKTSRRTVFQTVCRVPHKSVQMCFNYCRLSFRVQKKLLLLCLLPLKFGYKLN
jgi:hypothetical protein